MYKKTLDAIQVPADLRDQGHSGAANSSPFFPRSWLVSAGRTPHGDLVDELEIARARIRALTAAVAAALDTLSTDFLPDEVTPMAFEFTPRTNSEIELKKNAPTGNHRAQVA